ncbi:hypothetical protein [Nocardioides sp. SYSU D00065]|uniref:hypothetical protein n=1 Tax=Nocardioides sp. SYSU D00065 TaxID=2817378 RepID=UPI001B319C23|nr:hypothetical protein [Nocardioides sp. SYSU D00065]
MYLRTLALRAMTLAAATLTLVGVTSVVTAPAHAGQVGVTISITGAGFVRVVEGTVADNVFGECNASENAANPTATKTCARMRSEAPFEAWLWLRPYPSYGWKISPSGWRGCDKTRVHLGVTECGVGSGAFSSDERTPSITFYDDTPPTLTLLAAEPAERTDRTARIEFSANERVNAYCRIDGGDWMGCKSPFLPTFATDGAHQVDVQVVDLSQNPSEVISRSIELVDTVIEHGPPALTNSTTAPFTFSTRGGRTFQCSLDDGDLTYCGSGPRAAHSFAGLADGRHTVLVWAHGTTADPVPAIHAWVVDTVAPETTLVERRVLGKQARFATSLSGATAQECRITRDGAVGAWSTCTSPVELRDLADGTYTIEIRAKDAAGNVDPTPASHTWTVDEAPTDPDPTDPDPTDPDPTDPDPTDPDPGSPTDPGPIGPGPTTPSAPAPQPAPQDTVAPDTALTTGPAEATFVTSDRTALGWSATEGATAYVCTLDGAPLACSGTATELTGLAAGTHRFSVAAIDAAGNRDATPATRSWTVPIASRALKHGKGWKERRAATAYAGSYATSRRRGAVLSTRVRGARAVALVATTGRRHGTVKVYAGTKLLGTVRLSARRSGTRRVLPVATLPAPYTGRIRVVVARAGKQVRIEGLGIAS